MLFLISTPIGNLKDFTFRAIDTINECDYLLCEDTRHSSILLKHYQLSKPLRSFHQHNERAQEDRILNDLTLGKKIGLLSDAGTPGISDPGNRLVQQCRSRDIPVIPIPGPCAAIAAISASGLDTSRFQFIGFLPRTKGKLIRILEEILAFPGTTICYESPFRILKTLEIIAALDPNRLCVVAKEVTKKFERFYSAPASQLLEKLKKVSIKGEFVLMISS